MDSNLLYTVVFLIASIAYYCVLLGSRGKTAKKIKTPPYPSRPLPFIGHLHLLFSSDPFHLVLADIADKHEPTFAIRFGTKREVVILSRWEEAKEFFTVNDRAMLSRPLNSIGLHLGYNFAMFGAAAYGDYWNSIRRITMQELLSSRRADLLRDAYESEIRVSMKDLYRRATRDRGPLRKGLVDFRRWCKDVMMDVMLRLVVGKSGFSHSGEYPESRVEELMTAVNKFVYLSTVIHPSDVIGPLWWYDFQGTWRSMKETNRELDGFLSEWLEEHRRMRNSGHVKPDEEEDLMGILLSLADKGQLPNNYDVDTCIKATILEIFIDGVETTSGTIMWNITKILRNPRILEKAREELDRVVGRDRWIDESDTSKMPYLWAMIKENLRLDPSTPLLAPREAIEDCIIGGYVVPKGTMLLVNAWKVMRDPRVWPEPSEFRPERFLESESQLDVRGQHFNLIPFSSGRRSCPGTTFALRMLSLIIGGIIQGFDLTVPGDKPINDTETPALNSSRAHPLEIEVTPRLRADLYV